MDNYKGLAQYALDSLKRKGIADAECYIEHKTITEATYNQDDFSMLRSFPSDTMRIKGVSEQKSGEVLISQLNKDSIDKAVCDCADKIKLSKYNEYEGIVSYNGHISFSKGPQEPDTDKLLGALGEYADYDKSKVIPSDECCYTINHICKEELYLNTNGVDYDSHLGYYAGTSGPLNNCFFTDFRQPLSTIGKVDLPCDEALRTQPVKPLEGKCEGSLIFAPRYLRLYWWLAQLCMFYPQATLGIEGVEKHRWADSFNQQVTSPCFSLSNSPLDPRFCNASPFTKEGYLACNVDIIKNGVLNELLYDSSRYARMAGKAPNVNIDYDRGAPTIETNVNIQPGKEPISSIIAGINKGIIAFSLPGGIPYNHEGNFSGIVRGGLLIEDGCITRPISEVMVTGNFFDMHKNIRGVSSEYRLAGGDLTPWIVFDGLTIQ